MTTKKATLLAMLTVLAVWAVMSVPSVVFAFTPPSQGSFAYDVYDIAVGKVLKGPIGFVAGVAGIVFGATQLFVGRYMTAVPPVLGGALLLKAEDILTTLNFIF